MPETFIKPKWAIVEPGGGGEWVGTLLALFVGAMVVGGLIAFVAAHAVLIACCLAAAGVVLGGFVAWSRWISSPKRLAELRAAERAGNARALANSETSPNLAALPRGWSATRALPAPVVHQHIHLHGVTAEDLAAIMPGESEKVTRVPDSRDR